jgi:hypothetical protein
MDEAAKREWREKSEGSEAIPKNLIHVYFYRIYLYNMS